MTLVELLSICNKTSTTMRKQEILLAIVFRQDHVIFSASCRRGETAHELSHAFSLQELSFLNKSVFENQLSKLGSVLLEKVECPLQS